MSESLKKTGAVPSALSERLARKGFPAWGDWFVLLFVLLFSAAAGGAVAGWCGCAMPEAAEGGTVYPETWGRTVFVMYCVQMGLVLALTLLYRRMRRGPHVVAHFSVRGLNPLTLLWGIVAMLACSVVLEPLLQLLDFDLLPMPDPGRGLWALLTSVVAAPLFEELLCRGVVLESLRARSGVMAAWIGSSLFFGAMHLHPVQSLNAFVLGLLFGFFCLQTRSLWPSLILHAFNNALALLMIWAEFPGAKFDGRPIADLTLRELIGSGRLYAAVYAAALLVAVLSGVEIVRRMRRLRGEERKNAADAAINPASDTLISGK